MIFDNSNWYHLPDPISLNLRKFGLTFWLIFEKIYWDSGSVFILILIITPPHLGAKKINIKENTDIFPEDVVFLLLKNFGAV